MPEAGPTPSGRNFGRTRPHGVCTDKRFDDASESGIWWKEVVISKSTKTLNCEALVNSCCTTGIGYFGIVMYSLTAR